MYKTPFYAKDFILLLIIKIKNNTILQVSEINLQLSETPADNSETGGQWWTKREALAGFSVRHKIKHLNITKLWRALKFTSQLQKKSFQFGATQASPKWDVVQAKGRILYFTGTKEDTEKALVEKPAMFPVSSPAMENVFNMGPTKSHFTNH